jgi:hypothetical protein
MKLCARLALSLVVALLVTAVPPTWAAGGKTVLEGKYVWSQENYTEQVKATFTPSGEDTFDVRFDFRFDGRQQIYDGIAQGRLDGRLSGTVENGNKTYRFAGSFDGDGVFHGTHAELRRDREHPTGTLTLR